MTDNDIEVGPVDYFVVEWPIGSPPTGEAFPYLVDLVDRGLIHILDLAFVQKDMDGNILAMEFGDFDLDGNPDLAVFQGASSGLIDEEDKMEAGGIMEPGTGSRDPGLRELLGRPVRHRTPQDGRQAGGIRPHPNQRPDRNPRRARSRRGQLGGSKCRD